jgi:hypothetical protein
MGILRVSVLVAGFLAALLGLVWIGQGSGYFPYPASSFMINQSPWIWRGTILTIAGLIAIAGSRRIWLSLALKRVPSASPHAHAAERSRTPAGDQPGLLTNLTHAKEKLRRLKHQVGDRLALLLATGLAPFPCGAVATVEFLTNWAAIVELNWI